MRKRIFLAIPCLVLFLSGCFGLSCDNPGKRYRQEQGDQELKFREQMAHRIKEAITPLDPKVRAFALRMAGTSPGAYNLGQICAIWNYLKDRWRYVNDPREMDYVAPAFESIESNLSGDCDDFAVLMASAIEAIGGSARVIVAYGKKGGHAYCEVFTTSDPAAVASLAESLPQTGRIHFHREDRGYWLNLDYAALYPGGPIFPAHFEMAVYPDGTYEVLKER